MQSADMNMQIAFIGGGHMATSLVGGLRARGTAGDAIVVADPLPAQLERLERRFGVRVTADNVVAARDADVIVLAVKPQEMAHVAAGIAAAARARRPLVVSIAAGIRLQDLRHWVGDGIPLVRTMPNRPALIGAGITALYAGDDVSAGQRRQVEAILAACGSTVWLENESQMDVVTAVSGSGPAYFFLLMESIEAAGVELGLAPGTARLLAVETARGAGLMAAAGQDEPAALRAQVTSKGGTTAAALEVLEAGGMRDIFARAVAAATRRSAELARQFGGT
jgi:pyrroline-5-carboxylate reductase